MGEKRRILRQESKKKHIEIYNKIQNRYDNMFNLYILQPLSILDSMKAEKRSSTDQAAFDNAYEVVKKNSKILI